MSQPPVCPGLTYQISKISYLLSLPILLPVLVLTACRGDVTPDSTSDVTSDISGDCKPQCVDRACGPNGCGGNCGTCKADEICQTVPDSSAWICAVPGACLPDCAGKVCGPDGCGGSCGTCGPADACTITGRCTPCVPVCTSECGPDGCGSFCGTCDLDNVCGPTWTCVAKGTPCGELTDTGLCSGHVLTFCHEDGLVSLDCAQLQLECGYSPTAKGFDCIDAPCVPQCSGRACGNNGCGGQCGTCPQGIPCTSDGQCLVKTCVEDTIGKCIGDVLVTCLDGQESAVDCAELGLECKYDPDGNDGLGAYDCK